ncbi:MAG: TIGR04086 family membrane protein [Syntrophomonadaceae bacterium]|nr:TIGR04086 family membrane protein [Syntrophomonadaceae bacterium]
MFIFTHPVLRGFLYGLLSLIILGLIMGFLLYLTRIPETLTPLIVLLILTISVFMGGFKAARLAGAKGLINGLVISLLFIVLVLVITLVFRPGLFSWSTALIKLGLIVFAGACGGMLGIALQQD